MNFTKTFNTMEQQGNNRAHERMANATSFEYLGEIDCPEEMRGIAPDSVVDKCNGKYNWFVDSNNHYFFCNDYETEAILEAMSSDDTDYDDCYAECDNTSETVETETDEVVGEKFAYVIARKDYNAFSNFATKNNIHFNVMWVNGNNLVKVMFDNEHDIEAVSNVVNLMEIKRSEDTTNRKSIYAVSKCNTTKMLKALRKSKVDWDFLEVNYDNKMLFVFDTEEDMNKAVNG